ncbi:MAG TPA: bifunctional pyr operon transcriptional regulator/uracil phosphoribosyltransferase PyrR [Candidatus Cloacimonetes bacterium]|nr:bifunctional pyr operon transcriptional regulator/uracil phosphoribosyltransferase PyrR [Candidatus Cloacimonadota bacterium]HEX37953.1 bifunctional pyr operon transcriptional regulator/uracil phosphoribosyltransferase PyrR [Candidatus Cloacimonadota bacterium]
MHKKRKILDEKEMERILKRLANEVIEKNKGCKDLYIVGIHTRGVPLAHRIAEYIEKFEDEKIHVGSLDITLYRDDLSSIEHQPVIQDSILNFDIEGKKILLVDDVLNTGRTARAALNAILDYGRPGSIQFLVIIDRGNRELPIQADFVGKYVPTSKDEIIQIQLKETDNADNVLIYEKNEES